MKRITPIALVLGLATAPAVDAAEVPARENAIPLSAKAALPSAPAAAVSHQNAPFVQPLTLAPALGVGASTHEAERQASPSSCKREASLCYDGESGHIVFKPARNFMPDIPGMTRENISVKRDRIVFRYTF